MQGNAVALYPTTAKKLKLKITTPALIFQQKGKKSPGTVPLRCPPIR
jgi:hypothetical protein